MRRAGPPSSRWRGRTKCASPPRSPLVAGDVAPTFETLEAVARAHLRKKDYGAFQRATGTSVGELLARPPIGCDANATLSARRCRTRRCRWS